MTGSTSNVFATCMCIFYAGCGIFFLVLSAWFYFAYSRLVVVVVVVVIVVFVVVVVVVVVVVDIYGVTMIRQ